MSAPLNCAASQSAKLVELQGPHSNVSKSSIWNSQLFESLVQTHNEISAPPSTVAQMRTRPSRQFSNSKLESQVFGVDVGSAVGVAVDGDTVGCEVGELVGWSVGLEVGPLVGFPVDGWSVVSVGANVGFVDVGESVTGDRLGSSVVGDSVGAACGVGVGSLLVG